MVSKSQKVQYKGEEGGEETINSHFTNPMNGMQKTKADKEPGGSAVTTKTF